MEEREQNSSMWDLFYIEEGGSYFVRNVGEFMPDYTSSPPRRLFFNTVLPCILVRPCPRIILMRPTLSICSMDLFYN
jgi:hypothetical protein